MVCLCMYDYIQIIGGCLCCNTRSSRSTVIVVYSYVQLMQSMCILLHYTNIMNTCVKSCCRRRESCVVCHLSSFHHLSSIIRHL